MRKKTNILFNIIAVILIITLIYSNSEKDKIIKHNKQYDYQRGYYNGQLDYINNTIKIKLNPDSSWSWKNNIYDSIEIIYSPNIK
jgi:hypothetical protein